MKLNRDTLPTAAPAEIDTRLAQLHGDIAEANRRLNIARDLVHEYVGDRKRGRGAYKLSHQEAIADATERVSDARKAAEAAGTALFHFHRDAEAALGRIMDMHDVLATLEAECDIIDAEYHSHPWSRFIAVQDGHIHSGTSCAGGTIRVTTQLGWHPELSGKTEAEAVDLLGPMLCTHCFPSAPVEWTVGKPKADRCKGSGKRFAGQCRNRGMSYYGECTGCGEEQLVTTSGLIRAHKPKKG